MGQIAVVGAGLIGHAIALEFAVAGYRVNLASRSQESIQRGLARIRDNLRMLADMGLVTDDSVEPAMSRIHPTVALDEAVGDANVVIEAAYEDLALKQRIFKQLDILCPANTVLVSGTSTFGLSDLASATQRPGKVLLANYTNPPFLVPLVEILRNEATTDDTVATICDLLTSAGKHPVVIQQEVPGFVANRLQFALLREALFLVEQGIVSPQDVDTIIKNSIGRRWAVAGVFGVFELAGWDLIAAIAQWLQPHLDASADVSPVLQAKVERGELGVKAGKGFYDWTPETAESLRQRIAHALVEIEGWRQAI